MSFEQGQASTTVAAVLLPGERQRVDAAGNGCFAVVHRDSIPEAMRVVRERSVDAVLLSVHRCGPDQMELLGTLVKEFPAIPTVALVSQHDVGAIETLLRLGASGVRQVVDVTSPAGWNRLRQIVGQPTTRAVARIQGPVLESIRRGSARCPALSRGHDPSRGRCAHGQWRRGPALRAAQHAHVSFRESGAALTQELSRRHPAAPRRPSLRDGRALGGRCRLPAGVLLASELRPPPPRHAGGHGARVPAPVFVPVGARSVRRADDGALQGGLEGISSAGGRKLGGQPCRAGASVPAGRAAPALSAALRAAAPAHDSRRHPSWCEPPPSRS